MVTFGGCSVKEGGSRKGKVRGMGQKREEREVSCVYLGNLIVVIKSFEVPQCSQLKSSYPREKIVISNMVLHHVLFFSLSPMQKKHFSAVEKEKVNFSFITVHPPCKAQKCKVNFWWNRKGILIVVNVRLFCL